MAIYLASKRMGYLLIFILKFVYFICLLSNHIQWSPTFLSLMAFHLDTFPLVEVDKQTKRSSKENIICYFKQKETRGFILAPTLIRLWSTQSLL